MNLSGKHLSLLLVFFAASTSALRGQSSIDLNFQGMLADVQGERIGEESFDLSIQLHRQKDNKLLWEALSSTRTDESGWFEFTISDISSHLLRNGRIQEPVVVSLEFIPNDQTRWLRRGEDFMVTYSLTPTIEDNTIRLEMKRMEGSELAVHTEEHLFAFKDLYPFAFLTGGFLLTDRPPVSRNSIEDLRRWIAPEGEAEAGSASRGIKGGFAAGGYRKKD